MKKLGKGFLALFLLTGLVFMFGCSMVQDLAIPLHVDQTAIEYSGVKATSYLPWTTLYDGKRILEWIEFNHVQYQTACDRLKEDDKLYHGKIVNRLSGGIASGDITRDKVFNPNGVIGMAFPALFGGAFGALFINTGKKKKVA